jgi:cytochrome c553
VAAEDPYAAVRDKLEACFTCHGPNGASKDPQIPILAGQHMYYTYVQLKDFQAGRRVSPVMTEIMTGRTVEELFANGSQPGRSDSPVMTEVATLLSKEEMRAIATFFSEQAWPNIGYREDPDKAKAGQVATILGQCVQCHRGGYEGNSGTPRLAGQYFVYLEKTMLDFKSKARANAPDKSALMKTYSAEDIAGMAEFLAGM